MIIVLSFLAWIAYSFECFRIADQSLSKFLIVCLIPINILSHPGRTSFFVRPNTSSESSFIRTLLTRFAAS